MNTLTPLGQYLRSRHYAQLHTTGIDYTNKLLQDIDSPYPHQSTPAVQMNNFESTISRLNQIHEENTFYKENNIVSPLIITNANWLAKLGFFLRESSEMFYTILIEKIMLGTSTTIPLGMTKENHRFAAINSSYNISGK